MTNHPCGDYEYGCKCSTCHPELYPGEQTVEIRKLLTTIESRLETIITLLEAKS